MYGVFILCCNSWLKQNRKTNRGELEVFFEIHRDRGKEEGGKGGRKFFTSETRFAIIAWKVHNTLTMGSCNKGRDRLCNSIATRQGKTEPFHAALQDGLGFVSPKETVAALPISVVGQWPTACSDSHHEDERASMPLAAEPSAAPVCGTHPTHPAKALRWLPTSH